MNKTVLLVGAMVIFLIANIFMLVFVLNRSTQNVSSQQLAATGTPSGESDAGGPLAVAAGDATDPAALQAAMEIGKTQFVTCAACHGADGKGLQVGPQLMAPSLVGSQVALGDPHLAALVVLKGIKKETNDFVGLMAPLPIEDEPLAGVLTYVRNSFGNSAGLVKPEEVSAARVRFESVPALVSRKELDSLLASIPKVEPPAVAPGGSKPGADSISIATTTLPPVVKEPWVPIPGIKVVGGRTPSQRPENAPTLSAMNKDADWYDRALYGIDGPYPESLQFLEHQEEWYTPFSRAGMTGPYDIRNWHVND